MILKKQIEIILKKYPFLNFYHDKMCFFGIILIDEDDSYNLKIDISNSTNHFPKVYELDERIPRKPDRHINADNSLCFTTSINEEILIKTKISSLEKFFEHILIPYLINNSYFEINKEYKFGEYNHHPEYSIYETYVDILNINNFQLIARTLESIANGKKYRPNEICYCGSQIKIKKCNNHEIGYRNVKKLTSERLKSDSKKILKLRTELIKISNNL